MIRRLLGEAAPVLALTSTLLTISQLARISPNYYPLIQQAGVLPQVPRSPNEGSAIPSNSPSEHAPILIQRPLLGASD